MSSGQRTEQASGLVNHSFLLETLLSLSAMVVGFVLPLFILFYLFFNP